MPQELIEAAAGLSVQKEDVVKKLIDAMGSIAKVAADVDSNMKQIREYLEVCRYWPGHLEKPYRIAENIFIINVKHCMTFNWRYLCCTIRVAFCFYSYRNYDLLEFNLKGILIFLGRGNSRKGIHPDRGRETVSDQL